VVPESPLVAPIVPAAILMDLNNGGDKRWAEAPFRALGIAAANAAGSDFSLGNAGAGLGARAGAYKGGLGSASMVTDDGLQVGALVAVNSFGSPVIPGTNCLWAWDAEQENELGGQSAPNLDPSKQNDWPGDTKTGLAAQGQNTTIGLIATNADLVPAEVKRLAIMAQDGYARAIRPIHTPFDGDVVFALATGTTPLPDPRPLSLARLGMIAADCLARACARGVYEAQTLGSAPSYRSVIGV
jgi:L-aminopeptidase/D-esterase-like protein